ncbi:sensor histidine kinase [Mucilaginibacter puniceus]
MNNKIRLVVALMTLCVVTLIGLQCYWSYQSYQNAERVFKSDVNDALANAVNHTMDVHRQKLAKQYRAWLSDTNLVKIGIRYMDNYKINQFTLQDKHPIEKRAPFTVSYSRSSKREKITPQSRLLFINKLMNYQIQDDLKTGSVYYYTPRLGRLMDSALIKEKIGLKELQISYAEELAKRDIKEPFQLASSKVSLKPTQLPKVTADEYTTRQLLYGFRDQKNVSATFIDLSSILLSKIKGVLITLLLLIVVTIACFVYTVKTILSQKKLAQLKDDFVNNMTHELKTPVSTISIAAEAIQNFDIGKKASGEYLEIIRYQASALTNFIDQILQSMLNYQSGLLLERNLVNVNSVIEKSIQQCRPLLGSKKGSMSLNLPTRDINIEGDAIHIGNVLSNLIDNAIKYGGDPPTITIETKTNNHLVSILVSNQGDIIPIEYQNKIFERFFRIPAGDTHNVKGYGLGLSYARDIIQQHNGTLILDSSQEKTTFQINLPLFKA